MALLCFGILSKNLVLLNSKSFVEARNAVRNHAGLSNPNLRNTGILTEPTYCTCHHSYAPIELPAPEYLL